MRRVIMWILGPFVLLVLFGFLLSLRPLPPFYDIRQGMRRAEVVKRLGDPLAQRYGQVNNTAVEYVDWCWGGETYEAAFIFDHLWYGVLDRGYGPLVLQGEGPQADGVVTQALR